MGKSNNKPKYIKKSNRKDVANVLRCDFCGFENSEIMKRCGDCGNYLELKSARILNGRFVIKKTVGSGAMGRVYRGHDKQLEIDVAIKEMSLPKETSKDEEKRTAMFKNEAQILAKLNHISIPKVFAYFSENGRYYLVMEFIRGKNLRQFLAEKKEISAEKAIEIATNVLDSLNYLHTQKPKSIIHQDIKPENIMITDDGRIILVDFGVICLINFNGNISNLTRRTIFGTPIYCAPETVFYKKILPQSDLYSLGITMLWMLAGCNDENKDFIDTALEELKTKSNNGLYDIVAKAIKPDYRKRFASAKEMMQKLLELKENGSVDLKLDSDQTQKSQKLVERPDISSLDTVSKKILLELEDHFHKSGQKDKSFEFNFLLYQLRKHLEFLGYGKENLEIAKNFIFSLVHWKELSQHPASYELIQACHKEMTYTAKFCLEKISSTRDKLRNELMSLLLSQKGKIESVEILKGYKHQLEKIILDEKELPANRKLALEIYPWNCKEHLKNYFLLDYDDNIRKKILDMIKTQLWEECRKNGHFTIYINTFLDFVKHLLESNDNKLQRLASELLVFSIKEIVHEIEFERTGIFIDDSLRYSIFGYFELLTTLLLKLKSDSSIESILENQGSLIKAIEFVRGWSKKQMTIGFISILGTISALTHLLCYKNTINKRFIKLRKNLLDFLDNFVSCENLEIQARVAELMDKIKKL